MYSKLFFRILLIFISITTIDLCQFIYSQPSVTQEWVSVFGTPPNISDQFTDMEVNNKGYIFTTGWNISGVPNGNDIFTVKYSLTGSVLWYKIYNNGGSGGSPNDFVNDMAVDSLGNCYIAGYYGINIGPFNGLLIKYDSTGNQSWLKTLIAGAESEYQCVVIDRSNNIIVSAYCGDSIVTLKYNTDGDLLWRTSYSEQLKACYPNIIKIDKFNNIYIAGNIYLKSNSSDKDFLFIKYNSSGNQIWSQKFNHPSNFRDELNDMDIDNYGNLYATGQNSGNGVDITTVKVSNDGQLIWSKFYNSMNQQDVGRAIVCDTISNCVYTTGYVNKTSTWYDYVILKYSSNGDTLWTRTFSSPGYNQDRAYDVAVDKNSNVYITGEIYDINSDYDATTIKYSSNGIQQWIMSWTSQVNGFDTGRRIVIKDDFSIFISGRASDFGPNYGDHLVIKYSQPVGLINNKNELPNIFKLYQNYPNPFNPKTKIRFDIPNPLSKGGRGDDLIKLDIYNITGQLIENLVSRHLSHGTYEVEWDGSAYPSGIYFYSLTVNDFKQSKKAILLK